MSANLRPRHGALLAAFVVCLGLVAHAPPARAQSAAFNEAWNKGQDYFNLGKYDDARAQFEKARDLEPKLPGPWRYLGRIAKIQQRWDDCVRAATMAVKLNPDSQAGGEVRKDIDECRSALGRPAFGGAIPDKQGALAVIANVEGASVTVDGIKKGATPLDPFVVLPGKHTVLVEKRGYFPVEMEVEVVVTIVVDLEVTLEVDPNAKVDTGPGDQDQVANVKVGWILFAIDAEGAVIVMDGKPVTPREDGAVEADPGEHLVEITAPGHEPWRRRIKVARGQKRTMTVSLKSTAELRTQKKIAYVSFGIGVAALAGGAVFGLLENQTYEEARDMYETEAARPANAMMLPAELPESTVHTRAEYEDLKDKAGTYGLVSNVSFGVAAVALGVSVYYFIKARPAEREGYAAPRARAPGPSLAPTVGVAPGGKGTVFGLSTEWRW